MRKNRLGKLPALHIYPGDLKRDIGFQVLEPLEKLVWYECLFLMHDSEERGVLILNGAPMTIEQIARAINLDNQMVKQSVSKIQALGVCSVRESDGAIYSRRMVRDEEIRQVRIKAGRSGGSPILVKQKVKQNASKSEAKCTHLSENESEDPDLSIKNIEIGSGSNLHLSPDAPKNLRRKKTELKARGTLNAIWLTDEEMVSLAKNIGPINVEHLIDRAEDYSTTNPKRFKQYTDHFRVLLTFHQREIEKGKLFYDHPLSGPGYYYQRDLLKKV